MTSHRSGYAAVAVALCCMAVPNAGSHAAELLMLEQPGCAWCARFDRDVAPGYPHTAEGARAPLRRVDITAPWPADLERIRPERLTPTFVLLADDGTEVGRLRGYPGDHFFWPLLAEMMARLGSGKAM